MSNTLLSSPFAIGNCTIKNRVVLSPMLMGFGQLDGKVTPKLLDYYEARAKGGCGLLITEITRVNDVTGAGAFAQLAASHDYHIKGLRELGDRIHRHGAKVFVQLHHPGRQNVGLLVGTVPPSILLERITFGLYSKILFKIVPKLGRFLIEHNIVPRSVAPSACPTAYFAGGRIRALRLSEIKKLEKQFIAAARRVQKAGIDGVELHASHGYLLQQFLSPYTNTRTDEYGVSDEGRARFLTNIIQGIKKACGAEFPVIVRLTADECYRYIGKEGTGYDLEQGIAYAKLIEGAGADAIDVSSAGYDAFNYWLEPVSFEPGWRKHMAKAIKEHVSIPVIAANLIRSPEQAERQLADGVQDFVSLGRPQIADPDWANKAIQGQGVIKRCICCLNCIESMQNNAYVGGHGECSVNPFVGKEAQPLICDGAGRQVVVIGAGPAGLVCSELLARRGFDVTLYEKEATAGGQVNLAAAPPHKGKTAWFIEDAVRGCEDAGVHIVYNHTIASHEIVAQKPYAVIMATGSVPNHIHIEGEFTELYTFADALEGKAHLDGKRVAVVGSGLTGLETAHYLAERGCTVTILERGKELARGAWMQHLDDILPKLEGLGVEILTQTSIQSVQAGILRLDGPKAELQVDAIVQAVGSHPRNDLAKELSAKGIHPILVGDCRKVGKISDATRDAYRVATELE